MIGLNGMVQLIKRLQHHMTKYNYYRQNMMYERYGKTPYYLTVDEYIAAHPEAENIREFLSQSLCFILGDGILPGHYLMVHFNDVNGAMVNDGDDSWVRTFEFKTKEDTIDFLINAAPITMYDLRELFNWQYW